MHILILGAGRIGSALARYFASCHHTVTVVEQNEAQLSALSDHFDIQPILGYASYPDVLKRANAHQADVLIATTDQDEINMVACEIAQSLFHIETKIARIRKQNYLDNKYNTSLFHSQNGSIDFLISPEIEIARAIRQTLQVPGATMVIDFPGGFKLLSVPCLANAPIAQTPLRLIAGFSPSLSLSVVAITRGEQSFLVASDTVILPGDTVHFVVPEAQIAEAMASFGFSIPPSRNIMIAGGGIIGTALVREINDQFSECSIKILERNNQRAEEMASYFPNISVFKGDALNPYLLKEASIGQSDTFVAVTNNDSTNVLGALLAKNKGVRHVMTLLSSMRNADFIKSLGVDTIIDPNLIAVSAILRVLRRHQKKSLCVLDGKIEIITLIIEEKSALLGLSLDALTIPGKVAIIALKHEENLQFSPTEGIFQMEDTLFIAVTHDGAEKIEQFLKWL